MKNKKEKIVEPFIKNGQEFMKLVSEDGKSKDVSVARMVAEAFVPNPNNLPHINHINGNKLDNRAVNLEWVSSN
jgi:hypothetical protein